LTVSTSEITECWSNYCLNQSVIHRVGHVPARNSISDPSSYSVQPADTFFFFLRH